MIGTIPDRRWAVLVTAALVMICAGCKRQEKSESAATPAPGTTAQPAAEAAKPIATQPATAPASQPGVPGGARNVVRGIRAIWVTRGDYKTAADVTTIMENCRQGGFNHVIFQVRGNGTVFYPSRLEPWAEQFEFQSPGFDPLALAIQEAHARGLTLQAWVNVMPAWRGGKPPANPEQLYNKHPEWFWYDQQGRRQPLQRDFYVSLNPCWPEVRAYLVSVFRELAANYDIDALHLDYIRFPNEPPVIPVGSGLDYPRDARTLELYKADTGKAPDEDAGSWDQWRTVQVTRLVTDIRAMLRETRPRALLTASLGSEPPRSLRHFRDDLGWVNAGLVDMAFPMNYKPDLERFVGGMAAWMPLRTQVTVVPGLWSNGGASVARSQMQAAVEATGNFCFFSYASLYDQDGESRGRAANTRAANQRELLPYVQGLAAAAAAVKGS